MKKLLLVAACSLLLQQVHAQLRAEFHAGLNYSEMNVPKALNPPIRASEGGLGYNLGAGLHVSLPAAMFVRAGLMVRNTPLSHTLLASAEGNNYVIHEDGGIRSLSPYLNIGYERKYAYLSVGYSLPLLSGYHYNSLLYNEMGEVIAESKNEKISALGSDLRKQHYAILEGGPHTTLYNGGRLRGIFAVELPMQPLFNSGVYITAPGRAEQNYAYLLSFRAGAAFELPPGNKKHYKSRIPW